MALSLRQVIPIGVSLCALAVPAIGQSGGALPNAGPSPESREARLSPECRVPASQLYDLAPLQRVRTAVEQRCLRSARPLPVPGAGEQVWHPTRFGLSTSLRRCLRESM